MLFRWPMVQAESGRKGDNVHKTEYAKDALGMIDTITQEAVKDLYNKGI
jgi:hypothetical protein